MKIRDNAFVAIKYKLSIDGGEIVDQSSPDSPLGFVFGRNQIIPGLEKALQGLEVGDSRQVDVPASDGYGEVRDELIQELPRKNFPDDVDIEEGMMFQAHTPHGPMSFRVSSVKEDMIVADLNHPLAGKDLHFDVIVSEVREATEDDLHPHGCDGSHSCQSCGHEH
jgi:FKBP-type peptidyl-prolyl cis-trans isomerase SlyD